MEYKLVAIDMDDTVLTTEKELLSSTKDAIEQAIKKGVKVMPNTGRSLVGLRKYPFLESLFDYSVLYNGAVVANNKTGEFLFEKKLDNKDAKRIFELGKKFDVTVLVWSKNNMYSNKINDKSAYFTKYSGEEAILIDEIDELLEDGITKIIWFDEAKNNEKYMENFKKENMKNVTCRTSQSAFLEFYNSSASKGEALKFVADMLKIKQDEIIAIGDGLNDLSMIQFAGLGVSVSNGSEGLKKEADYVTKSNNEDGVGEVIRKFILKD